MNVENVKKGLRNVVSIAAPIFATVMLTDVAKRITSVVGYNGVTGYSDAVKAIMDSNMFSGDKEEAVSVLKRGENSDYYKAVIHIMESRMFSDDKLDLIRKMNCEER